MIALIEGLLGPSMAKYAKPLIYAVVIILLAVGLGVAKCSYDRSVEKKYQQKVEARAAPATDQAATERAADSVANSKTEQEMHNAIAAQPDQPISPTSHALGCERLRHLGRHTPACG